MIDVLTLLKATPKAVLLDSALSRSADSLASGFVAMQALPPVVDVPVEGLRFPFDWGPVLPGTDRVELSPLQLEVAADRVADFGGFALGELATSVSGGEVVLAVPAGQRIRTLNTGPITSESAEFRDEQGLRAAGRRLTVSQRDPRGGWAAPVVSVPSVDQHGQVPATLTGASFDNSVLRLPDLSGPLKLAIVEGATPDEFGVHEARVGTVVGWAAPTPVDLTLTGPDGTLLWTFAGPMPDGIRQSVEVGVPVSGAVEALRRADSPITGALTLTGAYPCRVRFRLGQVRGQLVRELRGTTSVPLAGEPAPLPLQKPLPPATPGSVQADVTVTYDGLRLADISDPLPPPGAQRGVVVRQQPAHRLLPPQALRGERVARIGLVGYCPRPSALLVRLVQPPALGTAAVGLPGTVTVDLSSTVSVIWVDLPEPVTVDQPVAIEVSASSGVLHWVADPEPLVRLVVVDPDPGGRPIVLGFGTLLSVDQPTSRTVRAALPAERFDSVAPVLASALFCTVELTDAELRYPRGM